MAHGSTHPIVALVFAVLVGACASGPSAESDADPTAQTAQASEAESDDEAGESVEPESPEGFSKATVEEVVSTAGGHAVILDDGGERVVPIFVGQSQAMAIKLRLERRRYSRPLTHDLLDDVVRKLGGEVIKVHIDAVKSGVFVGTVYIRQEGETHEIDARSSDAIALAVGNQVPIFVADSVFEKAGVPKEKFDQGGLPRRQPFERPPKKSPESGESEESEEEEPFY